MYKEGIGVRRYHGGAGEGVFTGQPSVLAERCVLASV